MSHLFRRSGFAQAGAPPSHPAEAPLDGAATNKKGEENNPLLFYD